MTNSTIIFLSLKLKVQVLSMKHFTLPFKIHGLITDYMKTFRYNLKNFFLVAFFSINEFCLLRLFHLIETSKNTNSYTSLVSKNQLWFAHTNVYFNY